MPLFGATLGIDGGAIFQILAVENLELSAAVIGVAFGFGVISVPIQIAAARMPLHRARRNVQLFLVIAAVQAWLLAALVAVGATGRLASVALAVTVTAEVALSVLFATAWQPLLSRSVDSVTRQRLNSMWPAMARGFLAAMLVLFAALGQSSRAVFLVGVGVLALLVAFRLSGVANPAAPVEDHDDRIGKSAAKARLSHQIRSVFIVLAAVNIGALPLWLVYIDNVLWPTANLGLIAAVQTVASVAALLAWRPTDQDVSRRALFAAIVILLAACALLVVAVPVTTFADQAIVVGATAAMAAGIATVRIAMLEQAHRLVGPDDTVRAFTLLDVVASTTLQVGLVAAGLLITAARTRTSWLLDPYEILLVASAIATIVAIRNLSLTAPEATQTVT